MKRLLLLAVLASGLSACGVSMTQQNKYNTDEPSTQWADGTSARPLPEHVVAQGDLAREQAANNPPPATPKLLARGRERFEIYCAPCHGLGGDGDGIIVHHGFPAPPSYHLPRLTREPASHFYDVISHGYGAMYSYADRVAPRDRWAIVAYIRALQLQRHSTVAIAPDAETKLP
ncbi:MAG TPA: cytochrome c [Pseudolabrys sp.]|jgi:mono/diheme cytochrome c family protein|nr:cytochrome c [Pseudolabrys sp.]